MLLKLTFPRVFRFAKILHIHLWSHIFYMSRCLFHYKYSFLRNVFYFLRSQILPLLQGILIWQAKDLFSDGQTIFLKIKRIFQTKIFICIYRRINKTNWKINKTEFKYLQQLASILHSLYWYREYEYIHQSKDETELKLCFNIIQKKKSGLTTK